VPAAAAARPAPMQLRHELAERLSKGAVTFDFLVQPYVNEDLTPIEDGSVAWTEAVSRPVHLATLTIPAPAVDSPQARASERRIDQLVFNPWHTPVFRPLGNLNRARKVVYEASSDHRLGYQFRERVPLRNVIAQACLTAAFKLLNRWVPWHRLAWR